MVTGPTSIGRNPMEFFSVRRRCCSFQNSRNLSPLGSVACRKMEADVLAKLSAHPLVAIAAETDGLAPPLMRYFVRSDDLPIHIFAASLQEKVPLCVVEEAADGQVDEHGPAL